MRRCDGGTLLPGLSARRPPDAGAAGGAGPRAAGPILPRRRLCLGLCLGLLTMVGCLPYPIYRTATGPSRTSGATPDTSVGSGALGIAPGDRRPPLVAPPVVDADTLAEGLPVDTVGAYQIGYASHYGRETRGRRTASGERYNRDRLTAAHRVLPLGTRIQVTNLGNGRRVEVWVNDRGPFVPNRIIDVSWAAAERLGMLGHGTTRVMIRLVEDRR